MKLIQNIKLKSFSIVFLLLIFGSCKKGFLNRQPTEQIPSALFYENKEQVDAALAACYYRILFGYWDANISKELNVCSSNAIFDCFADNGYIRWGFLGITSGNLNASNTATTTIYPYMYGSVAIFNDFISNVDGPKTDFLGAELKKQYVAEVKFLRAYVYFFLTSLYGDIPLSLEPQNQDYAPTKVSRAEVLSSIEKDLNDAIEGLPNITYSGHVVKGSASAMKMKVLLYQKKYNEVINLWNTYFAGAENPFKISDNFSDIFRGPNQSSNPEIMFSGVYVADQRYRNDIDVTLINFADAVALPNFMDAFEFDDGTEFSTSNPKFDSENAFNNRDPRLKMTLFDSVAVLDPANYYYQKLASGNPKGQLIIKKFAIYENLPASSSQITADQDAVLLRFADVVLMYAEAENELNGSGIKVVDALQKVRGRLDVNMPPVSLNLTKEQMRAKVRNERRVELAFEGGQRYFDLMRWKEMENIIPNIIDPNGVKRVWGDHNYLWPFPTNALNANKNLVQNLGYNNL